MTNIMLLIWSLTLCNGTECNEDDGVLNTFTEKNHGSRHLLNTYDGWITSSVSMPRENYDMAIGYYDNSIYLLGGYIHQFQLIEYDIGTNKMIDHGENKLPTKVYGEAQYYSVSNNIIFMIDHFGANLFTFDLTTLSFINDGNNIHFNIPYNVSTEACIASTDEFLYIVGGRNSENIFLNTLQIFTISTNEWSTTTPAMKSKRGALTCNIHPQNNMLYAIGGTVEIIESKGGLDTVEAILINTANIDNQEWEYLGGHLIHPVSFARSIIYRTSILVLGGIFQGETNAYYDWGAIQVIDITTGMISLGGGMGADYKHSAIIANDIIYVFGGYNAAQGRDTWKYFIIPSSSPTDVPTTSLPTDSTSPTLLPTDLPTTLTATASPTDSAPTLLSTDLTTDIPASAPMISTQQSDDFATTFSENIDGVEARKDLEVKFHVFLYLLFSFFILVSIIGFIHAKYIHQNDYFRISLIFATGLQISDMLSDLFFVINLWTHIYENVSYLVVVVISISLIVVPVAISIGQLWFHLNKHWTQNNRINGWIAQYSKYLYLLSFISGSSFTAISLFNCNFCSLPIFSMGLSKVEITYFSTKRLHSTVIIQNVPQIIIQIWYLTQSQNTASYIAISSLIFSVISIIVTVLSVFNQKKILNSQSSIKITMDVIGEFDPDECSTKIAKIKTYFINRIFGDNFVELFRPTKIRNGLRFTVQFYLIDNRDDHDEVDDYKKLLNEVVSNNVLPELIQHAWNINKCPKIQNLNIKKIESKYSYQPHQTQPIYSPFISRNNENDNDDFVYWSMDRDKNDDDLY
eukprot:303324_1